MSKVTLQSEDGSDFVVDYKVAMAIPTVRGILEDIDDYSLPLRMESVKSKELGDLIDYVTFRVETEGGSKKTQADFENFNMRYQGYSNSDLALLITASNFCSMEELLDILCKEVARRLKGKTAQQIRDEFGIKNDL